MVKFVVSWVHFGNVYIMKEQCFLERGDRRGRGVTVLRRYELLFFVCILSVCVLK